MLRISRTITGKLSRRTILEAAGAGLFGLTVPQLLQAQAAVQTHAARAKSVIFLNLFGGPSQLETFDMKPDAPSKIRGPFKPIPCKTPGLLICEHLPRLAAASDKFCVVRSMTHPYNDHSGGGHYIQTGKQWPIPIGGGFNATPKDWPSIGSVVEYLSQNKPGIFGRGSAGASPSQDLASNLPSYVVTPNFLGRLQDYSVQLRRPGEYAGWLGRGYDPLTTAIDKKGKGDNPYFRNCDDTELNYQVQGLALPAELSLDRVARRQTLAQQLDGQLRAIESSLPLAALEKFQARAFHSATSQETRQALDIRQESAELRDKYGRNLFGQSVLLARRLVEAGVRYVTVHFDACDGYSWDSHTHSDDVQKHLLPALDNALASLLDDLSQRGLLDETLVVCLGEMGRTPQANDRWGRQHWSTLFPAVLAGAGIRGGRTYGGSDKDAAYPVDNPTKPEDLAATIYEALGIDHHLMLPDATGRPVSIVEGGRPLTTLFGYMHSALIFDCDGTLTDSMPVHYLCWQETLSRYGIEFTEERFYALGGMPSEKVAALVAAEQGQPLDHVAVAREKEQQFLATLHLLQPIAEVVEIARTSRGRLKMAVASGGFRDVITQQLRQLGIHDWFDAIVTAEDTPRHKPEPDVFLEAARRLGVPPHQCLVYEDADLGIEAARRAGMDCIDIRGLRR